MDGVTLKSLTVDFHEPGLVSKLGAENDFGFWFQLSDDEKQKLGSIWGPANAQALNRYSYVQNNPLRWTDPSGHCIEVVSCTTEFAAVGAGAGTIVAPGPGTAVGGVIGGVVGAVVGFVVAIGIGAAIVHLITPSKSQDQPQNQQNALDDYPTNPDDWQPPEGWAETPAGEKTGGKHRQWKGPNGEIRRWDREGREQQPDLGPHWHDPRYPGKHILPTR